MKRNKALEPIFVNLCLSFTNDESLISSYWLEIETFYADKNRYYHNLDHVFNVLKALEAFRSEIKDWEMILFSCFYHDIIYDASKQDNETQSALLATSRLKTIGVKQTRIAICEAQILATQKHTNTSDEDVNLFLDADLSILGSNWEVYKLYAQNIRKEYHHFSDDDYSKGRKRVLKHFLAMERIYKTGHFFHLYEKQAKENLQRELNDNLLF